jgi:ATP-dependent DNA helicase RecG
MADVTDEREKRILGMIKANNRISLIQLAKNLSVTKMTIMRDIEKLKEKQKIKRYGNNKSGYWEIY